MAAERQVPQALQVAPTPALGAELIISTVFRRLLEKAGT